MQGNNQVYTCQDYRQEMILLALRSRLEKEQDPEQRQILEEEIHRLQQMLGLD
ncbi:MAG: hypothetical protein R6U22_05120 [Desulfohalobiaceae bacterium]